MRRLICLAGSFKALMRADRGVWILFLLGMLSVSGCAYLGVRFAPEKTASLKETELSRQAQQTFWNNFHEGQYEKLPETTRLLTAAYLENPRHPKIALLLAHAHFWKVVERSREGALNPQITDEPILAERYFTEAARLNPDDDRIPGWLGGLKLVLGSIHQDEKLTREGFFMLQDAINRFPEFNYFSAGYPMSGLLVGHKRFEEGVEYMWKNLEACANEKIDPNNPDYGRFMGRETAIGPKRVCWNSEIAPHNFEGFFLNMGDMLIKNGEVEKGKKIYAIAQLSKGYSAWKYRTLLEERIATANERAILFRGSDPTKFPEIMLNSSYACMACHER